MQADGDGGFEGGCFMLDRVGGCYSTLFVVMWSDRRVATSAEEPLKWGGWFFRESRGLMSGAGPMFCGGSRYNFCVKD